MDAAGAEWAVPDLALVAVEYAAVSIPDPLQTSDVCGARTKCFMCGWRGLDSDARRYERGGDYEDILVCPWCGTPVRLDTPENQYHDLTDEEDDMPKEVTTSTTKHVLTEDQVKAAARVSAINWQQIIQDLVTLAPLIITILTDFGILTPPTPAPTPTPPAP